MPKVDLNLVRTFVTVFETRSVTAAARSLHLTQPTVTHSLNRLRRQLEDDLFVRSPQGVTPTAVAVRAYPRFIEALNAIDSVFLQSAPFQPVTSTSTFRVGMSDAGEVSVLPPLAAAITESAPHASIEVAPLDIDLVERQLTHGELDCFVSSAQFHSPLINRDELFQERYVVLVADEHPRIGTSVTAHALDAEPHIAVVGVTGHQEPARLQRERDVHIRVQVPRFTAVPHLVAQSDAVAILPHYIAEGVTDGGSLRWVDLPWPVAPIKVCLHARHPHSRSPEQAWFIDTACEALRRRSGGGSTPATEPEEPPTH